MAVLCGTDQDEWVGLSGVVSKLDPAALRVGKLSHTHFQSRGALSYGQVCKRSRELPSMSATELRQLAVMRCVI